MKSLDAPRIGAAEVSLIAPRIGIAGLGLIGGSLLRALSACLPGAHLIGYDTDTAVCAEAERSGQLHAQAANLPALVDGADLVFLCQPLPALLTALDTLAGVSALPVLCDVASVKRSVCARAAGLGERRGRFVAAHPIAGKAESGWAAADAMLFDGCQVVLCPEGSDSDALAQVRGLWLRLGARPVDMDADRHDRVYAALSHLPQVLTWAYIAALGDDPGLRGSEALAGPGFASFTRLGRSDPQLWTGIAMENREELLQGLERLDGRLGELREALTRSDATALQTLFGRARASPILGSG